MTPINMGHYNAQTDGVRCMSIELDVYSSPDYMYVCVYIWGSLHELHVSLISIFPLSFVALFVLLKRDMTAHPASRQHNRPSTVGSLLKALLSCKKTGSGPKANQGPHPDSLHFLCCDFDAVFDIELLMQNENFPACKEESRSKCLNHI